MTILPRVIPCLLLKNNGLVKTTKFKDAKYIGDPINAVKVFNEKEVDELVFLDITKSIDRLGPNIELLKDIASEAFMPMAYGGGLASIGDIERVYSIGFEKVILNSVTIRNPEVIKQAVQLAGSSGVVVSVDVKRGLFGGYGVMTHSGSLKATVALIDHIKRMEEVGVGEILLGSIDRDGTSLGYDLELLSQVSKEVSIPVVPVGGASCLQDFAKAINAGASAVAAGGMFVYYGKHRAVLISYPEYRKIKELFT